MQHADTLLKPAPGQTTLNDTFPPTVLTAGENSGSIVLDFGAQISGYLELFCPGGNKAIQRKARIRFGESVSETMAEPGERLMKMLDEPAVAETCARAAAKLRSHVPAPSGRKSPAAPGFAKVRITPDLGDLEWAEGTYPTPKGIIKVRHERQPDGSVKSDITLPPGVGRVE